MPEAGRIYLDHNAGAPLLPAAREAMAALLGRTGNASSVHREGREARREVERARVNLAERINTDPRRIVFTSGASEAASHALSPTLRRNGQLVSISRLYVSAIEHPAVLCGGRFHDDAVERLPVGSDGALEPGVLEDALSRHEPDSGPPMVALMLANNETGVVQPVAEAARMTHAAGGYLLVDAVQGLGKREVDLDSIGADFAIFSSHKIGGPQGAGALVVADEALSPPPLVRGGGQEGFNRAGTENVAAIAGFGAAIAGSGFSFGGQAIRQLRDYMEAGLRTICREERNCEPVFFGGGAARLDNTSCFAVPGISAETALISLDLEGIALSSGSACSSGKVRKSHVLAAMGIEDGLAGGALRISLGPTNSERDVNRFLDAMKKIFGQLVRTEKRMAV